MSTIQLVQNPIIKHSLEETGKSVSDRLTALNIENQVATEDTVKALKKLRAELNKEAKDFEVQRKTIKDAVLNPYNEFESVYKSEIIEKYKQADETLKIKINDFEMKIKSDKRNNLIAYFNELCEMEQIDWLKFERLGLEINLSTSEKKYKEQILEKVQKIVDDLSLISSDKYSSEMLVEYKKTLNVSFAIKTVRERKEAERIEAERRISIRTNKRKASVTSLYLVYHDLTRTYNWVNDEKVLIRLSDIENMSDEEWIKKYTEIESVVKSEKKDTTPLQAPVIIAPPTKLGVKVENTEVKPADEKKEETFEAKFLVVGTHTELINLSEFLRSNKYKYQNID